MSALQPAILTVNQSFSQFVLFGSGGRPHQEFMETHLRSCYGSVCTWPWDVSLSETILVMQSSEKDKSDSMDLSSIAFVCIHLLQ